MLLQKVTGLSRAQLISHDEDVLSKSQLNELNAYVQQRLDGRPMAYIMGYKEFFGRDFTVSDAVLIPRPETEHLVEAVLESLSTDKAARVWDLGTGSGIIAITLKLERPVAEVFASDLSEQALTLAQENARQLGAQVRFAQGSWFAALSEEEQADGFDFIVSNPPYIEQNNPHLRRGDVRFEPQMALTDFGDGLSAYRALVAGALPRLKAEGWLMMEHGFAQKQAIQGLLIDAGYRKIETLMDLAGLDRVTFGQK